jgi:release factor glutamine methyltransferase
VLDLGPGPAPSSSRPGGTRRLRRGVDLSTAALAVAGANAERHGVQTRLELHQGSWLAGVSGKFDLIVSNPPYIPAGEINSLAPEVRNHDPRVALCGGEDGLEAYRQIASNTRGHLAPHGRISVEMGAGQKVYVFRIFLRRVQPVS